MHDPSQPVLVLGGGINGTALARELALNGVPVCLVESADLAFGATAYATRLIHGGLRYLEYGEFDLVRESLAERTRLLRLAPQFVQPLRLFIPIENRWSGVWNSARRFLFKEHVSPTSGKGRGKPHQARGLLLVQAGLRMYDTYARDPLLPHHATHRVGADDTMQVSTKYRWLCSYYDAQIRFPERFVVAMLEDGRRAAADSGAAFDILTGHRAELTGDTVRVYKVRDAALVKTFRPAAIVNATGAWVDSTLNRLGLDSPRLIGGTKGTHIVTWNERLRAALTHEGRGYNGLYAEAADGRPVFVLPFGDACLIGTTDEVYTGDPAQAVATKQELAYLLATANELLPGVDLTEQDVDQHYSGVRPLPYVAAADTASVTRRHMLTENPAAAMPFFSVIGGKLTTCRSLAEEITAALLPRIGRQVVATSEDRPFPGAAHYPADSHALATAVNDLAARTGYSVPQVVATWQLFGTSAAAVLQAPADSHQSLVGTDLPIAVARYVVDHEWIHSLDDLVERRLMLLYHRRLYRGALVQLAEIMATSGLIPADQIADEVERCTARLRAHFGKAVLADAT